MGWFSTAQPKDPMQMAVRDALISFMAALHQAQGEAIKEARLAGIGHARARDDAYRGRKPFFLHVQATGSGSRDAYKRDLDRRDRQDG